MTNRALIYDGAKWILQGDEQERENQTAGVKALYSMLASTTSGRAKELVREGLTDGNGMIAFGYATDSARTLVWRSSQTCFSSSGTSPDSLEDKVAEMAEADEASEHDLVGRQRS